MTRRELRKYSRKFRAMRGFEQDEVIDSLKRASVVEEMEVPTIGGRGRKRVALVAAERPGNAGGRSFGAYGSEEAGGQLKIELYQHDWIPGFAAFADDGSIQREACAHVVLNLGAVLLAADHGDIERAEMPYFIAETIMHEVIHALESWAGVEFSEDRVEALLDKYRQHYMDEAKRERVR